MDYKDMSIEDLGNQVSLGLPECPSASHGALSELLSRLTQGPQKELVKVHLERALEAVRLVPESGSDFALAANLLATKLAIENAIAANDTKEAETKLAEGVVLASDNKADLLRQLEAAQSAVTAALNHTHDAKCISRLDDAECYLNDAIALLSEGVQE
jgi:hypothetical protein